MNLNSFITYCDTVVCYTTVYLKFHFKHDFLVLNHCVVELGGGGGGGVTVFVESTTKILFLFSGGVLKSCEVLK